MFLVEEEGQEPRAVAIPDDFSDIPADVVLSETAQVAPGDTEALAQRLLAYRLNIPLEASVELLEGLLADGQ